MEEKNEIMFDLSKVDACDGWRKWIKRKIKIHGNEVPVSKVYKWIKKLPTTDGVVWLKNYGWLSSEMMWVCQVKNISMEEHEKFGVCWDDKMKKLIGQLVIVEGFDGGSRARVLYKNEEGDYDAWTMKKESFNFIQKIRGKGAMFSQGSY